MTCELPAGTLVCINALPIIAPGRGTSQLARALANPLPALTRTAPRDDRGDSYNADDPDVSLSDRSLPNRLLSTRHPRWLVRVVPREDKRIICAGRHADYRARQHNLVRTARETHGKTPRTKIPLGSQLPFSDSPKHRIEIPFLRKARRNRGHSYSNPDRRTQEIHPAENHSEPVVTDGSIVVTAASLDHSRQNVPRPLDPARPTEPPA